MSKIGELRRQVEAEPDSHEVRWQLAKTLYAESDYREALTHLRILKSEWERRLNVLRYLAASYYRLGRYDEAINELLDCIKTWPNELSLREQLAKVYSVAGHTNEANEIWREILELDPGNHMARKALKRADDGNAHTPYPARAPHESDDGVDLRPVTVCPHCGAQNSAEFERCWQCGSALDGQEAPEPMRVEPDPAEKAGVLAKRLGMLTFAGLMAAAVFVTVRFAYPAFSASPLVEVPRTVAEVLLRELAAARITLWAVLMILCPVILVAAVNTLKIKEVRTKHIFGLGTGFATAVYLGSWLSVQYIYATVGLTIVLLLPAVIWTISAGPLRNGAIWALLVLTGAGASTGIFFLYVGMAPFEQAQAITEFAAAHDGQPDPGVHPSHTLEAPAEFEVSWASTGSEWLDGLTNEVTVIVESEPPPSRALFEFYIGRELADFVDLAEPESRLRMRVRPDTTYRVIFRAPEGTEAEMHLRGVLTPQVVIGN